MPKYNSKERCCCTSAFVLPYFCLTKCHFTFFGPETIVSNFLHLLVLFFKVMFNNTSKRQLVVIYCRITRKQFDGSNTDWKKKLTEHRILKLFFVFNDFSIVWLKITKIHKLQTVCVPLKWLKATLWSPWTDIYSGLPY